MKRVLLACLFALALAAPAAAQPYSTAAGTTGGATRVILTSGSPIVCTVLSTVPGKLVRIINTGPAIAVFVQFFDEALPTCSQPNAVYGDGATLTLGAGQIITLEVPLNTGLSYKISGALSATSNLVITRY